MPYAIIKHGSGVLGVGDNRSDALADATQQTGTDDLDPTILTFEMSAPSIGQVLSVACTERLVRQQVLHGANINYHLLHLPEASAWQACAADELDKPPASWKKPPRD